MPIVAASPPLHAPNKMAALGHTLPFYTGAKPTFPMDTALAVIITIFLTALVTFIIILPGIRGKMVRNKPSPVDSSPGENLSFKSEKPRLLSRADSGEEVRC